MKTQNNTGLFIGLSLIIIGLLFFIKIVFDLHFPVMRLIISIGIILLGVYLLTGKKRCAPIANTCLFGNSHLRYNPGSNAYSVIFSDSYLMLNDIVLMEDTILDISCIFGKLTIMVPRNINLKVNAAASFAQFTAPNGTSISFGTYEFQGENKIPEQPTLTLKTNVVFGNMEIIYS